MVDVARDRVEIHIGFLTQYFAARRIDRQDLAGEAMLAQGSAAAAMSFW
jgi:hypothetical protein